MVTSAAVVVTSANVAAAAVARHPGNDEGAVKIVVAPGQKQVHEKRPRDDGDRRCSAPVAAAAPKAAEDPSVGWFDDRGPVAAAEDSFWSWR